MSVRLRSCQAGLSQRCTYRLATYILPSRHLQSSSGYSEDSQFIALPILGMRGASTSVSLFAYSTYPAIVLRRSRIASTEPKDRRDESRRVQSEVREPRSKVNFLLRDLLRAVELSST